MEAPAGSAPLTPAEKKAAANRHAVFFGTLDGSLGILVPIEEGVHSRLQTLQRRGRTGGGMEDRVHYGQTVRGGWRRGT